jgi:hypothetical protein
MGKEDEATKYFRLRPDFEKWASDEGYSLEREHFDVGRYASVDTRLLWAGFVAGSAAAHSFYESHYFIVINPSMPKSQLFSMS